MSLQPYSGYVDNPSLPFVSFQPKGGGIDFAAPDDNRPQHLIDFHCTMYSDQVGQWSITLFDAEFQTIEKALLESFKEGVTIQFGWQNGPLRSPKLDGFITDYRPEYMLGGSKVTIQGYLGEYDKAAFTKDTIVYPDSKLYSGHKPGMRIDEIVKEIADRNGWGEGTIEETLPNKDLGGNSLDSTDSTEQAYVQQHCTDWQFITEYLAPRATSKEHPEQGDFHVWYDPFNKKLHFRTYTVNHDDPVAELTYLQDRLGEITNFEPDFHGGLWIVLGGAKTSAHLIDATSGQPDKCDDLTNASTDTNYAGDKIITPPEKAAEDLKKEPSTTFDVGGAYSRYKDNTSHRQRAMWNAATNRSYANVQLTIVGHPGNEQQLKYTPLSVINLNVRVPPNVQLGQFGGDSSTQIQYLSGLYMITGVTHVVTTKGFVTELTLMKNAGKDGDSAAPE